jgi:hypothetical protein
MPKCEHKDCIKDAKYSYFQAWIVEELDDNGDRIGILVGETINVPTYRCAEHKID